LAGIGLDAQIAYRFHALREAFPEQFGSQLQNKMQYGRIGAEAYFFANKDNAMHIASLHLECDGKKIDLEGLEGIMCLNIPNYGGGAYFWGRSKEEKPFFKPSISDKMIEVIGVRNSLHMGQIQVGLGDPVRICQGRELLIRSSHAISLQCDGEPWTQNEPWELRLSHRNQAMMLSPSRDKADNVLETIGSVLDWAEATDVITASQRITLLKEMSRRVNSGATPELLELFDEPYHASANMRSRSSSPRSLSRN